jgi:spermidine synthase
LPFLFPEHLKDTSAIFASLFKATSPYMCTQPCYFGGPFALNWASDGAELLELPVAMLTRRMKKRGITTRYYTPEGHRAAFALPGYVARAIASPARSRRKPEHARRKARVK